MVIGIPSLYTLYPVTPTLSVEAFQVKSILDEDMVVAVILSGILGVSVSDGFANVVSEAGLDCAELFPAASKAETVYVYVVDELNPGS